jgi:DNA-directed RNA polymerase subunit RPC12/RpoP
MSTQRSSTQRRLITPESWGKKNALDNNAPAAARACTHCSHKGLREEQTIAGQMYRCPSCKKLQF